MKRQSGWGESCPHTASNRLTQQAPGSPPGAGNPASAGLSFLWAIEG
jgi:hypothetical protein